MVQWTLTDHLNTVRDIAKYDPQTDTTTVVNHLVYDAFGRVTSETNPAVDSLFLFTARPFDEDTGLQNNLNRWYDPAVGRWLSEDPIGYKTKDFNLYRYLSDSPLTRIDPSGLKVEVCCRPTNICCPVDATASAFGAEHCWIRTSQIEAGMGRVGGGLPEDAGGSFGFGTEITDHTGESNKRTAHCHELPGCNERCVNDALKMGTDTGAWVPGLNDCHVLAQKILEQCGCHNKCVEWGWEWRADVMPGGTSLGDIYCHKVIVCKKRHVPNLPAF